MFAPRFDLDLRVSDSVLSRTNDSDDKQSNNPMYSLYNSTNGMKSGDAPRVCRRAVTLRECIVE